MGKESRCPLSADIAKAARLRDGERIEIAASGDDIVIRKLAPEPTLESMFTGQSPDAWRALYRDAFDWGPDRGRERVEE